MTTFVGTRRQSKVLLKLAAVGFEPTPPKRLEPKSSALDRSATLPSELRKAVLQQGAAKVKDLL